MDYIKELKKPDYIKELKKPFQIITLNKHVMKDVAHNSPTWLAAIFFGVWALISGIIEMDYMLAIGKFVGAILIGLIMVLIYFWCAKIFGAKGKYIHLYRSYGYALLILGVSLVLVLIPYIGMVLFYLVGIWEVIVLVILLKNLYSMKTWKAILAILLPAIIVGVLVMLNPQILSLFM